MTPEELSHYHEHGFVVQPALFSRDELQVWLDRLGALIRGEAPKSHGMLIMRDVMIAKGAVEAPDFSYAACHRDSLSLRRLCRS